MLQDSHAHLKHQELTWNPSKQEIIIRPVNRSNSYLLITNSVKIFFNSPKTEEENCEKCNQKITGLIFTRKEGEITKEVLQQELEGLKYCLVQFDKASGKIEQVIGYHNIFNQRKSILITQNLVVSSEKAQKESQVDRALYYTAHSSKEIEEDFQEENLSSSVVFSLQKDVEVIEKYQVYVAKLQSQVQESYGNNMFYEYAWTESQIQDIMKKIESYLGPIHSLVPRRRYLCFTFSKNKNDCYFKNKYETIGREILLRQTNKIQGNFLNYYLVSRQQLLKNEEQTAKLFLLPNNERITDMIMLDQWIIIAAETYLLSVHSQRPMQYFHHEQNVYPTKLATHHTNGNVFFAAGRKGHIFRFQLLEMKIVLTAKYQIPFVRPFSMVHLQTGMAIGGIDIDSSRSSPLKTHKRSIYLVKTDNKPEKSKQIGFEVRLEIVIFKNSEFDKPIRNIISTKQADVVACNWHNKFYLVSLKGLKLIEVELKLSIVKMMFVPFLFNHLNFLLLADNGEIIRIGIESYGESLGAELNPVKACNSKDILLIEDGKAKFEIYSCEGKRIDRVSYLTQAKKGFLNEQYGKILNIASSNCGLAYLVDLEHSIQLKFLQV